MFDKPIIFIDTETTGVDVANDRIIELSMLKLTKCDCGCHAGGSMVHIQACCDSNQMLQEVRTKRFNPGGSIPKSATDIHGISDEDVKNEKPFAQYAKAIHDMLIGCDLAGFNSNRFDFAILFNEFVRAGVEWDYKQHRMIDVGNLYKQLQPRTLTAAVNMYCNRDHNEAHGAEADAIATKDVFYKMLLIHEGEETFPKTLDEIAAYSNFNKPILDLSGKFGVDEDGDIIFTFGKWINQKAKDHLDFVTWMIKANFPLDTLRICNKLLNEKRNG